MKKKLHFYKLSGSGNDFVIIDNISGGHKSDQFRTLVHGICSRNNGVGADGLIVLHGSSDADFRWDFFNSDGSVAEMCGNGSRCAARLFAELYGRKRISFQTLAGLIEAEVGDYAVKVRLSDPVNFVPDIELYLDGEIVKGGFINTGVPHFVVIDENADDLPVRELGRKIRFHERFSPDGTNVNFVRHMGGSDIKVRTYERGVEDETLACGTGASAAALICGHEKLVTSPVGVITSGGEELKIYFTASPAGFSEVYLEGRVRFICEGDVFLDELPVKPA